jgi:hypothetical protein
MGIPLVLTQQVDSTTWQALGLLLTVVGLVISVVVWRSRGAGHGLRAAGWSLLPLAAGLTGVLRLGWEVLDSVLRWGASLVFSPVVWLGLAVAVLGLVLHVVGGLVIRRSRRSAPGRGGADSTGELPGASRPADSALPASTSGKQSRKQDQRLVEDQDDIEAILRKHGIS